MSEKLKMIKDVVIKFCKEKKTVAISIGVAVILLLVAVLVLLNLRNSQGNISGNLRNGGMAIAKGSGIYYLKIDNTGVQGIYKVSKSGNEGKKITSSYGEYLNISGSYLYYLDTAEGDIVKIRTNGENKELLVENVNSNIPVTVHNGWIYYSKDGSFYRIKTNGKEEVQICEKSILSYQIDGNLIYYSYIDENIIAISKMKLDGNKQEEVGKELGDAFYVKGNTLYYISEVYDPVDSSYTYELCSIKTSGKDKKTMFRFEDLYNTDSINMNNKGIYYLKDDGEYNFSIAYINYNGKGKKDIIAIEGNATPINVIDNWIFYVDRNGDDMSMYKVRTDGKNKQAI